jgi:hypothetical protein
MAFPERSGGDGMTDDYQAKYGAVDHEALYRQLMAGDPDQVEAIAARISSLRDTLGGLRDSLNTDLAGLAKGWSSDAGTEYQRRLGLIRTFASDLHLDLDSVHTTLTSWAGPLREAKKHAEDPADTDDNNNTVKDAAIGVAIGSPLGPPGMAVGGLIGGFMGHDQDEEERQKAHDRMIALVAGLAADYVTSDRMPDTAATPGDGIPVGTTHTLTYDQTGPSTHTPHTVNATGDAVIATPVTTDPTRADGITTLAGAGEQTTGVGTGDPTAIGGIPGTGGGHLLSSTNLTATGLGAAAVGLGAYGASRLPFAGANLANAEASGAVGRPGNLFAGTHGGGLADEGALGINRGTGGAAAARRAGDDEDEEHRTWLTEDEMVWGDDLPNAPAVLGADPPADAPTPRPVRPRPLDQEPDA